MKQETINALINRGFIVVKNQTYEQNKREKQSRDNRNLLYNKFFNKILPTLTFNGDEKFENNWASYHKALPHNELGLVEHKNFEQLLYALNTGYSSDFDKIVLGTKYGRKLANPQAAFAFDVIGCDSWIYSIPPAPSATSAEAAAEMVEVYAKALLRDIPFNEYNNHQYVKNIANYMNKLVDFKGPKKNNLVTTQTLFRGNTPGDLEGNYISQFLLLPVKNGAMTFEQKYITKPIGTSFLTDMKDLLDVQNGVNKSDDKYEEPRYIVTGRDLAEFVHIDHPYQAYMQAALILYSMGVPANKSSPYYNINNQGPFITFGAADLLTLLGEVTRVALKAAWVHKWIRNRRLRPEVFALRIETNRINKTNYPIHIQAFNNEISKELLKVNGNLLLPAAYPEGSPTHPSYPAGHATIAGACVTVLKAFFDNDAFIKNPKQVNENGSGLEDYYGKLSVVGELNKLANNIAIGRNIAGVHYRADGDNGLLLGEQVAINVLSDLKNMCNEPMGEWKFNGFDGNIIYIK